MIEPISRTRFSDENRTFENSGSKLYTEPIQRQSGSPQRYSQPHNFDFKTFSSRSPANEGYTSMDFLDKMKKSLTEFPPRQSQAVPTIEITHHAQNMTTFGESQWRNESQGRNSFVPSGGGSRLNTQTDSYTNTYSQNEFPGIPLQTPSIPEPSSSIGMRNTEFVDPEIAKLMYTGSIKPSVTSDTFFSKENEKKSIELKRESYVQPIIIPPQPGRDYISPEVRKSIGQFQDSRRQSNNTQERNSSFGNEIGNLSYKKNEILSKESGYFNESPSYKKSVRWNIPPPFKEEARESLPPSTFQIRSMHETPQIRQNENSPTARLSKKDIFSHTVDRGYIKEAKTPGRKSLGSLSRNRIHLVEPGSIGRAKIKIVYTNSPMSVERIKEYDEQFMRTQRMIDTEFEESKKSRHYLLNTLDFLEKKKKGY